MVLFRASARVQPHRRKSERELVVTRTFNAPARIVFEAWTTPGLFTRWWVPKSMGMSLRSWIVPMLQATVRIL